MEITIDEFKEQYLPELQNEFHQKTQEAITKNIDRIKKSAYEQMETFIKLVAIFQETIPLETGMIQVALLNTSLYLGKPQIAYTAYDENGLMGQELITMKRDVSWLFEEWDGYIKSLEKKVTDLHCELYIRAEAIRQLAWESFPFLQGCLYATTKYVFRNMRHFSKFDELYTTDEFAVRVGAYMDWGGLAFRKSDAEPDIFFDTSRKNFQFCQFQQAVYNRKSFQKLNLRSTSFTECEFVHCVFEQVDFSDAQFTKCRFYHCSFNDVKLYGITFDNSTIKKTSFTECHTTFDPQKLEPSEVQDIYKPMEVLDCIIDEDSEIRGEE